MSMTKEERHNLVRSVTAAVVRPDELSGAQCEKLCGMIRDLIADGQLGIGAGEVARTASARLWTLMSEQSSVSEARTQLRNWLLEDLTALTRLL